MRQLVSKLMRFNFISRRVCDVRSSNHLNSRSYVIRNAEDSSKYFAQIQDFYHFQNSSVNKDFVMNWAVICEMP